MEFDPQPFQFGLALLIWLGVFGAALLAALVAGIVISYLTMGATGPAAVWTAVKRGFQDLGKMSLQRIGALTLLTIRESWRRRDLLVGVVFVLLFMFAGWFLGESNIDTPAKPYISFVLTAIRWMIIPVALLLSCWGLPADIKARSLHTVVTKPVRRSEVVLGRMLGYSFVITIAVLVMGTVGYIWLRRTVPPDAQKQMISRVPVYGELQFLTRSGEPGVGINTGDIWEFREYIEGNTKSRGVYTFRDLDVNELKQKEDGLRLEYRFEIFRSHKGDIEKGVLAQFDLVNEKKGLRVPWPQVPFEAREFAYMQARVAEGKSGEPVIDVPRTLKYRPEGENTWKTVDLFDDLIDDGTLTVAVRCLDSQQYLGAARPDLFVRMPDRPFLSGYSKAVLGIWLMAILIVVIGTTASTFVKGPVATLLTFTLILVGQTLRPFMGELIQDYVNKGRVLGGGMLESAYRMATQMNVQSPLPEGPARNVIQFLDNRFYDALVALQYIVPNFTYFNMTPYVANGFDVPLNSSLLPAIATTLGFLLPCLLLGYFSLQLRELEAK